MADIKVLAVAAALGLAAYAVVRLLVFASRETGLLQWMAS